MEQKNGVNSHRKYAIREFKCHLTSTVDVAVAFFFFVLLLCLLFENKRQTKIKLKVSG